MMRILVAEDDDNSRLLQETLLSASGYGVATAADGEQALASIRRRPPDLVLTDILMPKMDGYVLCRRIKEDPELNTIPVIFYTATYTDPRDEAYAMEIGAARFLVKPMEVKALLEVIAAVLAESRDTAPQTIEIDPAAAASSGEAYAEVLSRKLDKKVRDLQQAKKDLEHAMRTARLGNWIWLIDEDRLWLSRETYRLFDLDPEHPENTKTLYWQVVHPEDQARVKAAMDRTLQDGAPLDIDYRILLPDKSQRFVHEQGEIHTDPVTGRPLKISGTIQDITGRKMMEMENAMLARQLQRAQKLEAIGTLASGIAHDFNNLLTPILGFSDILRSNLQEDEKNLRFVERVINSAELAKDLVQQILTISRKNEAEKKPIRFQSILKDDLKLLRAALPSTIAIEVDIASKCRPVMADPTQLHQVVLNLGTNAYHAMRRTGGTLSVSLTEIATDPEGGASESDLTPENIVRLQIRDTGTGMDKATRERVFDPYFTTKSKNEGTGLGLAVVHGIVTGHGGRITVESEPGKGSRFCVDLPAIDTVAPSASGSPPSDLRGGDERILLIDDETDILELEKEMLARHGYRVTVFSASLDALAHFEESPEAFDLVITDLTMPKVTGVELARRIHALNPRVPILACSGCSDLIENDGAETVGVYQCLTKPLNLFSFVKSVRDALDQARAMHPGQRTGA